MDNLLYSDYNNHAIYIKSMIKNEVKKHESFRAI